ncbi:MAG: adenylyl-sulfate kinase [Alphaproteobacteria bacterium]
MNKPEAGAAEGPPLRIVIVGHVDHGKSTLVGRLLYETGSLPEGKLEELEAVARRRGMAFEWAFVTDAFQPERDQGVTIDVSYIRFRTALRPYVLVDAPGHREFLKNMVTGAAASEAALLVVDASEGVREQTRRHGYLLNLIGLRRVAVIVAKMDLVDYDRGRFDAIAAEASAYLAGLGLAPTAVVPVSARNGDNLKDRSPRTPWYGGPTVVESLDSFPRARGLEDLPLRFPVQAVYRFDQRRIIAGRIETGRLSVGDTLLFSPANVTAVVKSLEAWNRDRPLTEASAGQSIGLTLEDQVFVERGEIASHVETPPVETNVFRAHLFWLGRNKPLTAGASYTLKLSTRQVRAEVQSIERVVDTGDLSAAKRDSVERNAVAEVVLRTRAMLALDPFTENPRTGRFVLVDGYEVVGGGTIGMEGYPNQRGLITVRSTNVHEVEHRVGAALRAGRNHHASGVLWFTGLSGAGKSTLAIELERRLFAEGYQVYVLDGDNVRRGLNANLSFSPDDRAENIRRVGEVAALFADAGFIVITAFISPYRSDRDRARAAAGDRFHEIHIEADLETCERRDPKGLYKRARSGEIKDFTGVGAPYEPPAAAELVVDTGQLSVERSVAAILDYVRRNFALKAS